MTLTAKAAWIKSGAGDATIDPQDEAGAALHHVQALFACDYGNRLSRSKVGLVYFAAAGDEVVKIGVASDPLVRLRELQSGNHLEIQLLATVKGGRVAERAYHERFARDHIRGEWFKRTPEIEAEIARLQVSPAIEADLQRLQGAGL